MSYETETAGRYRNRAKNLRSMAKTYEDRAIANAVARIANDYDLMARVFDGIDAAGIAAIRARNSN